MTPDRLEESLHIIRWTPETLAEALECDISLVNAWLEGEQEIPMKTGAWIQTLASLHQASETEKPVSLKGKRYKPPHDA